MGKNRNKQMQKIWAKAQRLRAQERREERQRLFTLGQHAKIKLSVHLATLDAQGLIK